MVVGIRQVVHQEHLEGSPEHQSQEEHPEVQAPEVPAALAAHLSPRNLEEEHPGNHLAAVEGIDSRIPPAVVEPALQLPPPGPSDQPASHVQQAC